MFNGQGPKSFKFGLLSFTQKPRLYSHQVLRCVFATLAQIEAQRWDADAAEALRRTAIAVIKDITDYLDAP